MKRVVVKQFGGTEVLELVEESTPEPAAGQVRVRLTSIGMNHADLMARRGEYRLASGEPPFTPGLEGGGVVEALGSGVAGLHEGQRVTLSAGAPRRNQGSLAGTYATHFVAQAAEVLPVPPGVPDEQLGTFWLTHLTAWGCLVWKQRLEPGQTVAIPAASSGVGLAASQIARRYGAVTVGMTTSSRKVEALRELPQAHFDHLIVTQDDGGGDKPWHRELLQLTGGRGVDVFFDPVAAGRYLDKEIRSLAQGGTIWVYGLLGTPDKVDVSPLIRKWAAIRGWVLTELVTAGGEALQKGCEEILNGFASGIYSQAIARRFSLEDVREAHQFMEKGDHVGKLVLLP